MRIGTAIQVLNDRLTQGKVIKGLNLWDAVELGIEALVRIEGIRVVELDPELHHLPAETEELNSTRGRR